MRDRVEQFHDAERARISRWFRDSEHGWMMFAPDGRAVPLLRDEADKLEGDAYVQLDRYCRQLKLLPLRMAAILFMGITAYGLTDAENVILQWAGWAAVTICGVAFAWEASTQGRFRLAQTRRRNAIAKRYASRGTIEAHVAAHHRRYNIFRLASGGCALSAVGLTLWQMASQPNVMAVHPATIVLAALAWLLWLPAEKVDATHRRRKWL